METGSQIAAWVVNTAFQAGIRNVIVCPGSRSAPLIIALKRYDFQFNVLVDERSAAYHALGIALATESPVMLVCTSGTAATNFYPAVAEAYFRKVPLLVLTADRPEKWINQLDGQAIFQQNLFGKHARYHAHLQGWRIFSECRDEYAPKIQAAFDALTGRETAGPVHLNLAFEEPLYGTGISDSEFPAWKPQLANPESNIQLLYTKGSTFKNILVLAGQGTYPENFTDILNNFCSKSGAVWASEPLSGLSGGYGMLQALRLSKSVPDLLITFGGQVLDKKAKQYLRHIETLTHWQIDASGEEKNTFLNLKHVFKMSPESFLEKASEILNGDRKFAENILHTKEKCKEAILCQLEKAPENSDLKGYVEILKSLPDHAVLHAANSTPVRYLLQLWPLLKPFWHVESNRGASGIDGCTSTAIGYAKYRNGNHFLFTGDLAFQYDNNALWGEASSSLKILLFNNKGGNIFRVIEGSSSSPYLEDFFEVRQPENSFEHLAKHYGWNWKPQSEWKSALHDSGGKIIEFTTDPEISATAFKTFLTEIERINP